jgi:Lar family restriction alleviation protein
MAELLPCPFCGALPRIVENKMNMREILYGVLCCDSEHHTASVGYFYSIEAAIEAWNRRAGDIDGS